MEENKHGKSGKLPVGDGLRNNEHKGSYYGRGWDGCCGGCQAQPFFKSGTGYAGTGC